MIPSEILEMFAAISNIDNRVTANPTREMAYAWANVLQDVSLDVAQAAVVDYYRSERYAKTHDRITTGDIVDYARRQYADQRAQRRHEMNQAQLEEVRAGKLAIEAARKKPIGSFADRFAVEEAKRKAARSGGDPEAAAQAMAQKRRAWRQVSCPYCKAAPYSPCVVPGTQRQLAKRPAHPAREEAAEKAAMGQESA